MVFKMVLGQMAGSVSLWADNSSHSSLLTILSHTKSFQLCCTRTGRVLYVFLLAELYSEIAPFTFYREGRQTFPDKGSIAIIGGEGIQGVVGKPKVTHFSKGEDNILRVVFSFIPT